MDWVCLRGCEWRVIVGGWAAGLAVRSGIEGILWSFVCVGSLAMIQRSDWCLTDIYRLKQVFNGLPSLTTFDLAGLFCVSRQTILKWLSGELTPEPDRLNQINELCKIADAFQASGVSRAGVLMKMKAFDGRSLMDLIKIGENRSEHVMALISEGKAMEASYRQSGLAASKSKSSGDWQSYFSIPGCLERG